MGGGAGVVYFNHVWVLRTPNACQNLLFQHFFEKKLKKEEKQKKIQDLQKKFAPKHWSRVLFPEKTQLSYYR